jgi:hypothetical protein
MAITRTPWIDDDGTGTTGTVINNAEKQLLYDQIDAALAGYMPVNPSGYLTRDLLFSPDATYDLGKAGASRPRDGFFSRNLTADGLLTVNGFGSHNVSAGATGANMLSVRNSTAGAGNYAGINVVSDTVTGALRTFASNYTPIGSQLAGGVQLFADGAGGLALQANHASGAIRFYTGGTVLRWTFTETGHILPNTNGTQSVGSATVPLGNLYAYQYLSTYTTPCIWTGMSADGGTAVIVTADGSVRKLSSSARYKEHLAPLTLAPDMLTHFVECSPRAWDYTGQQTGAVGFIAEDLADIAPNDYGRSALLNYDAEGRPESNRDFALIGLQHLVIQNLWHRVAALESRMERNS